MAIGLSEALQELRSELYLVQEEGRGQQLRFEVEKAELELEVEFHRDAAGKLKVSVGAFGAEAGGGLGDMRKQRLTLTLNVRDEAVQGQRAQVARPNDTDEAGLESSADRSKPQMVESPRPWDR